MKGLAAENRPHGRSIAGRIAEPSILGLAVLVILFLIDLWFIDTTFLTPYQGSSPVSPLFSFHMPASPLRMVIPLCCAGFFITALGLLRRLPLFSNLLILFAFMVIIRVTFASIRHDFDQMGTEFLTFPGDEILFDVGAVETLGPGPFLEAYPDLMPKLSLHGQHYPPGNALLLHRLSKILGGDLNLLGWALVILSSTMLFPILLLAKKLFVSREAVLAAGALLILFPSSVVFGAVSLSAFFAAVAAWPVYLLVAGFGSRHRTGYHLACGILLGAALLFNFCAFVLGLLLFILAVIHYGISNWKTLLKSLAAVGIGCLVVPVGLYVCCNFDLYRCFVVGRSLNEELIQTIAGGEQPWVLYLHAVWCNYLAFFIGLGFPVFGAALLWLLSRRPVLRAPGLLDQVSIALILTVLICGCSGLFFMETERIWLFLAVFFVLPAVRQLTPVLAGKAWLCFPCLLLIQTGVQEYLLFAQW